MTADFLRCQKFVMEQRTNIKFLVKYGKNASETFEMLKKVYGDDCLSRSNVFIWHKRFSEGRESVDDDERPGRPRDARTPENIQKVREFIAEDRNATTRMIAEALGISHETARVILTEDLQKKKVCAHFVPHTLRDYEMDTRVDTCRDIVAAAGNDPNFLNSIVTGDETWCFQYDPETKRQSAEWLSKEEPRPKKAAVTRTLKSIPNEELAHSFQSLLNRCNKCIDSQGDYFE